MGGKFGKGHQSKFIKIYKDRNIVIMLKMNPEEAALTFYLTYVFAVDLEESLSYCHDIWPFLIYFLTDDEAMAFYGADNSSKFKTSGYLRIQKLFLDMVTATWGEGTVHRKDCHGKIMLGLKLRYDFDEVSYITPSMTTEFHSFADINSCVFGISKLAMRRHAPFLRNAVIPYFHTGLALRRADGGLDLAEVRVDLFNARLEVRDCLQVFHENPVKEFFLDTRSIKRRGNVDPIKTLFRMSMICGRRISYGLLTFNCDHIAQWLFTSDIMWTTKVWEVPESHLVPQFPLAEMNKDNLLAIEDHIKRHDNIKSPGPREELSEK